MLLILIFIFLSIASSYLLYLTTGPFLTVLKEKKLQLRGIAKKYALENMEPATEKIIQNWIYSCFFFSIIPCLWIGYFSWGTDYSFLVGLFPLLWYYFITRYFLWEKHDLYDISAKDKTAGD